MKFSKERGRGCIPHNPALNPPMTQKLNKGRDSSCMILTAYKNIKSRNRSSTRPRHVAKWVVLTGLYCIRIFCEWLWKGQWSLASFLNIRLYKIDADFALNPTKHNRCTEECSKLKKSVDMTSSGLHGLNISTNASPKCDRTKCPEEKASSVG